MWNLVRRAINRFLAAQFIKVVGWLFFRYAAFGFLLICLFILVFILNKHLGEWASGLAYGFSLAIPFLMAGAAFSIFGWAISARAIEPMKQQDTLTFDESEMDPLPPPIDESDATVYELYPKERDSA